MSTPQRTFSFDYHDDENSLNQHPHLSPQQQQQQQQYQGQSGSYSQPYRDQRPLQPSGSSLPPGYDEHPPASHENPFTTPPRELSSYRIEQPPSPYHDFPAQRSLTRKPVPAAGGPFVDADPAAPPPPPPPHSATARQAPDSYDSRYQNQPLGYSTSTRTAMSATPGMDNFGESAAGGGIAGVALGVAANNERESGVQAMRALDGSSASSNSGRPIGPAERQFSSNGSGAPFMPAPVHAIQGLHSQNSYSSTLPLGATAVPPGMGTPGATTPRMNPDDISLGEYPSHDRFVNDGAYPDGPYNRYSNVWDPRMSQSNLGGIDPSSIADDGDDDGYSRTPHRRSNLNLTNPAPGSAGSAVPAAAAAAGGGGFLGGFFGAKRASMSPSGSQYGPVPGETGYNGGFGGEGQKSEWLTEQKTSRKKLRWVVGFLVLLLIVGAIVGAIVGGIIGSRNNSPNTTPSTSKGAPPDDDKGDLNINSADIKKLMGNPNLHKVFPGMDYTPLNAQYPACLTNQPSQNNVTRDVAVISQLTNQIRLYGTDCNQTEMVLHAIKQLGLTNMKVWLGVWQENNDTTNARQLAQMYQILDANGADPFAGVIIGNEVLFRKDMTATQLGTLLSNTKSNFTAKNIKLPIATSDLGDDWTATLAGDVDIVMANIHPFFAGVRVEDAASWAINFWQTHDIALTNGLPNAPKNIISEIGWPSGGGTDCGASTCTSTTAGSVAGIDQMNTFMNSFVCQALNNGTQYFWFEAFDEPWKVQFNTPGKEWEDKWGLMDINRNLKSGLKIPDCGGKTVS